VRPPLRVRSARPREGGTFFLRTWGQNPNQGQKKPNSPAKNNLLGNEGTNTKGLNSDKRKESSRGGEVQESPAEKQNFGEQRLEDFAGEGEKDGVPQNTQTAWEGLMDPQSKTEPNHAHASRKGLNGEQSH